MKTLLILVLSLFTLPVFAGTWGTPVVGTAVWDADDTTANSVPYSGVGTITAGDALFITAAAYNSGTTITTPSGYDVVYSNGRRALFIRPATGAESGSVSIAVGGAVGGQAVAQMFRVPTGATGWTSANLLDTSTGTNNTGADPGTSALTLAEDSELVIFTYAHRTENAPVTTPPATSTSLSATNNPAGGTQYGLGIAYVIQTTKANISASSWNLNGSTSEIWHSITAALKVPSADPTITDVETTEIVSDLQTNVTITGTDFLASQGAGNVEICDSATHAGATCVSQTETSWSNTAVDITVSRGALTQGTRYVFLTTNGGLINATGFAITLNAIVPTITDVETTEIIQVGATGITITGTNFEAAQGTGQAEICNSATYAGATCAAQAETPWANTAIDITVSLGTLSLGTNYVFVTNGGGGRNTSGFAVTLTAAAGAPTFDVPVAWVSASATVETFSFNADATADNYYCGLFVPGLSRTAAQVKAGTGAHGTATGVPTGNSQNVNITATDSPVWPYYSIQCVLEDTVQGLGAVSSISGSYLSTPMDPPANETWVAVGGSVFTGGLIDGASPTAVAVNDIIRVTYTTPGSYVVVPLGDGDFYIIDGGDPLFRTFAAGLWRLSNTTWDGPVTWSINNQAPSNNGDPLFDGILGGYYIEDIAITSYDMEAALTDFEGHTITCDFIDALPTGLVDTGGTLSGTPTTVGNTTSHLECTDTYGGLYQETVVFHIVSGLVPNIVGQAEATAITNIQGSGYIDVIGHGCSSQNPATAIGLVERQSPAAAASLALGGSVSAFVSTGYRCSGSAGAGQGTGRFGLSKFF